MKMIALMAVMAIVTYIIRALPITLFRKEIKSKWLKSFLYYIPYAVLGAMTFPAIFFSTGSVFLRLARFGRCYAYGLFRQGAYGCRCYVCCNCICKRIFCVIYYRNLHIILSERNGCYELRY